MQPADFSSECPRRARLRSRNERNGGRRLEGLQILLVDAERFSREDNAAALGEYGCEVRQAASGLEALSLCRCFRPDAVILAWTLPGSISAWAVADCVRAIYPGVGVIFLTGLYLERVESYARHLAPCAMIEEPCSARELAGVVGYMVGRSPGRQGGGGSRQLPALGFQLGREMPFLSAN